MASKVDDKTGNIKDAAGVLKVHPDTVTRWIKDKIIPPEIVEQYGKKVTRINLSELERFKKGTREE